MTAETGTTGWTARGACGVGLALLAAILAFSFLYEDRGAAAGAEGIWAFVTGTLFGHALGGFVAGWLLAGLFGRGRAVGWVLALVGGIVAVLLAGLLGGVVTALPSLVSGGSVVTEAIRVGTSAFVGPLAVAAAPWLGLVWFGGVGALHVAVQKTRGG